MTTLFIIQNSVFLFARIILAVVFLYYGIAKIRNLKANAKDFHEKGFRPGWLFGTLVAIVEVFGGFLLGLGIFTAYSAGVLALHMITGTIWKVFFTDKKFPDYSYDLILLSLLLIIVFFGPGIFSLFPLIHWVFI